MITLSLKKMSFRNAEGKKFEEGGDCAHITGKVAKANKNK